MTYQINNGLRGFQCLKCATVLPVADYPTGCPNCLAADFPASVKPVYTSTGKAPRAGGRGGMARHATLLPYITFPSLGEGDTPLVEVPGLAMELGLAALHVKCESQSPTGSHKDRMSCLVVARAVATGAPAIVAASSGNAGVSVATYAAAAGLRCVIVTTPAMNPIWRRAIEITGAELVATERSLDRWRLVSDHVRAEGWFPATNFIDPPVGSNCWGVDGYKTVAFELFDEAGADGHDFVLVPTSRGDLLWGIYEGYRVLLEERRIQRMPRLVAVEPHPRLTRVLAGEDHRGAFPGESALSSIGGSTVAWQAVLALRSSGGAAIAVSEPQVRRDQECLAHAGLYLELSAAATLTALRGLREDGTIKPGARAALIGTANGFREMPESPKRPIELANV
ncbi:MAG: pyridoxal-phosphate dependent enzyme [Proteobacteria bacterium]|nr:pyridoxal-phosphate dependent enzyme [Pseudomonadota bacterium]